MVMLGHGILNPALAPVKAIADVARRIRAHPPFSPAEVGPLKDLHRVRIVETIASSINPAPVIASMRRIAAAAAVAIPIAMTPALAAPRLPTIAPGITAAMPHLATIAPAVAARAPGATLGMTTRAAPTSLSAPAIHFGDINVKVEHRGGRDDDLEERVRTGVEEALEKSDYKLSQILRRERENQDRTNY